MGKQGKKTVSQVADEQGVPYWLVHRAITRDLLPADRPERVGGQYLLGPEDVNALRPHIAATTQRPDWAKRLFWLHLIVLILWVLGKLIAAMLSDPYF